MMIAQLCESITNIILNTNANTNTEYNTKKNCVVCELYLSKAVSKKIKSFPLW